MTLSLNHLFSTLPITPVTDGLNSRTFRDNNIERQSRKPADSADENHSDTRALSKAPVRSFPQTQDQQSRSLAQLTPLRPQLSPSDELTLFANQLAPYGHLQAYSVKGEAVSQDGSSVSVEILTANDNQQESILPSSAQILSMNPRMLALASAAYAKSSDLEYASYLPLAV